MQGEGSRKQRAENWKVAIGLQEVDGLKPSEYLLQTAARHIDGDISIDEVQDLLHSYYKCRNEKVSDSERTEEADMVASRISKILGSDTLSFSTSGYMAVHRNLFTGIFGHAGRIRDYDISKNEWVLNGDSVRYMYAPDIRASLDYDLDAEKKFSYSGMSMDGIVRHISRFVSDLWQIHAFGEGNTRTTAVFTILYLRSIGFDADNTLFSEHSWYFRNALVRANYKNAKKGIDYDFRFLEMFFRNLLMNEKNELHNRDMLINPPEGWSNMTPQVTPQHTPQVPSQNDNPDIFEAEENICSIVHHLAENSFTALQLMKTMNLKDRKSFRMTYLEPAIASKFISMQYPDKPNHPRQKYRLTVKGNALYDSLKETVKE